jgi:competence protein ComEA
MNKFIFSNNGKIYAEVFGKKISFERGTAIIACALILCVIVIAGIMIFKTNSNTNEIVIDSTKNTANPIETGIPQTSENPIGVNQNKEIRVYVTGYVKNPGVFRLNAGSIIADAIYLAGGGTEEAALANINLVYVLKENSMITVKSKKEVEDNVTNVDSATLDFGAGVKFISGSNVVDENTNSSTLININIASESELQNLKGIGVKKSQDIIAYREANKSFKKIEEIMNVKGIGQATFDNIKSNITV